MAGKYLLRCDCGRKIGVEAGQAGATIRCRCGQQVEVPTMRGLSRLPRTSSGAEQPNQTSWGPLHGLIFVAVLIAISATVAGASLLASRPTFPQRDVDRHLEGFADYIRHVAPRVSFEQAIKSWQDIKRHGLSGEPHKVILDHDHEVAWYNRMAIVSFSVAALGLTVAVIAVLVHRSSRTPRSAG